MHVCLLFHKQVKEFISCNYCFPPLFHFFTWRFQAVNGNFLAKGKILHLLYKFPSNRINIMSSKKGCVRLVNSYIAKKKEKQVHTLINTKFQVYSYHMKVAVWNVLFVIPTFSFEVERQ